jgi:hypothetical protein
VQQMHSDFLDLDAFIPLFADLESGQSGGPIELPLEVNALFSAREIHSAGVTAYQSEIRIGGEPNCQEFRK